MSLAIQTGSSNTSQDLPVKRKRGRPRKDQSLNRLGVARKPPGFERVKESRYHQADNIDDKDGMVGQVVTGVVEASFDAGYLLTVRIGSSRTILRGVVFKPGHYVPVTSENDVAPHVQMIHRSAVNLPLYNQTQSSMLSREGNDLYRSSPQSASTVVSKGKSSSPTAGSLVPQVGARGTMVPVVLQPLGPSSNGPTPDNQVMLDASLSKGKDVVAAEPLAMLLPDVLASSGQFRIATTQQLPVQVQTIDQVSAVSAPIEIDSNSKDAPVVAQREEYQELKPARVLTPGELTLGSQGSSQSSETHDNDKSSAETSNTESDQDVANIHSSSVPNLMNNHATGRMTELLQALQENFDNQVPPSEPFTDSGADSQEKENSEINPKDERMDD